jgi:ATP-dependent exoDNAse (exonuclease V) beta subunit (contains helicase and exonuclease domains)
MTEDSEATPTPTESTDDTEKVDLTDEQEDALVLDRNVTITAGAGTGKTTTLTERYLELLRSDPAVTPKNIVTISFTRKAAAELETRVREEVYNELEEATAPEEYARWRGVLDDLADGYTHTVHAFCGRLLRENAIQAPVPMQFDTLDENDAADLQRQVVVEYIEANESDADVQLASQLFGSHSRLVDILTGLLDERPDSEAWLETWRDRDVDDYMGYLWEHVCDLDAETARAFFDDPSVKDALTTATRFREEDFGAADDADGVSVLRDIATVVEGIDGGDDREYQQTCRELYDRLETSSGGLYSSASYHLVGTKSSWNNETDAYSECKEALNTLIDQLSEIESKLKTTPGEVEENSAHYAIALLRVFDNIRDAYEAEKEQQEALDFPDLIETTIQFLNSNPDVRATLRESFAALMIDEFQDTDGRQWELVSLLADLADDEVATDNVFLVGDKKQSIYSFRGAEVTTFDHAKDALRQQNQTLGRDKLPGGSQSSPIDLELSGNFRTLEHPLTFLNELFEAVFEPEDVSYADYEAKPQRLTCERNQTETPELESNAGSVEYLLVPEDEESATALLDSEHPVTDAAIEHTTAAEAEALAGRLAALLADPPTIVDEDTGEPRMATSKDVAILLRRRTHLDRYQRALEKYNIPHSVASGRDFTMRQRCKR